MITGVRKADGATGVSPDEKKHRGITEGLSQEDNIDKMFEMMMNVTRDMSQTKLMAQTAQQTADMAMETVTGMRNDIKNLQIKDDTLMNEMKEIKRVLTDPKQTARGSAIATGDQSDEDRQLQVIFKGLGEEIDEEKILLDIQNIIKALKFEDKCDKPFTFSDPSRIGIVKFKSVGAKVGFFRKFNQVDAKWSVGSNMEVTSNDTKEKRAIDTELGLIKHVLGKPDGKNMVDVKIKWKKGIVEAGASKAEVARIEKKSGHLRGGHRGHQKRGSGVAGRVEDKARY